MRRVYLIHWNAAEVKGRLTKLRAAGYEAVHVTPSPEVLREMRQPPPEAFVIDLSRLPSQGRDLALNFRHHGSTRKVPLVFVDGAPEKVELIKQHLPDATYATWDGIRKALKEAIANPPENPTAPASVFAGYADAPLVKKLGIKAGFKVALVKTPSGFRKALDGLPEKVRFAASLDTDCDLVLWFLKSKEKLGPGIETMASTLGPKSGLWICWPKKASGVKSDLTQQLIRDTGLARGLVDYKICSIDETWTGLKFAWRKPK